MTRVSRELLELTREHYGSSDDMFAASLHHYGYSLPWEALTFGSHAEVKRALAAAGSHFYDRQALRFFNAKTSDAHLAAGSFWVESKRFEDDPRTYQVAYVVTHDGGETLSVERLEDMPTLAAARKLRSQLAELVKAYRAGEDDAR